MAPSRMKAMWDRLALSAVMDRGIRLGIRFRFILLVTLLFLSFAGIFFYLFSSKINDLIVRELQNRVDIQADYLSGYGFILIGNQDRNSLKTLLHPILSDDDLEYLVIRKVEDDTTLDVYSTFRTPKFRSLVINTTPEFPREKPVRSQIDAGEVQIVQTAIPVYQEEVDLESFDDFESILDGGEVEQRPVEKKSDKPKKQLVGYILYGVSTANSNREIRRLNLETLKYGAVFLLVVLCLIYLIISYGFNPLVKMADISHDISRGDLTARVPFTADDEIGDLASSFNRMVDHLSAVIERIQQGARRMQMVATQIAANTDQVKSGAALQSQGIDETLSAVEELNSAIKDISSNINLLSQSAEESSASTYELNETIKEVDEHMEYLAEAVGETVQIINETSEMLKQNVVSIENLRASIEETATSMNQVDVSINEITQHSKASAESARSMFQEAADGKQAVDKTMEGLQAISRFSNEMSSVIGSLEEKSKHIALIVDVIDDIADQTNLLALNASIIAAQAGDKGKSFAVVASQIKELSNRTAESIQEISKVIHTMQEEVLRTSEAMKFGEKAISEGNMVARQAGESLSAILERAGHVVNMSQEIEKSTAEHARGAHQVKKATEQVKDMVHHIQENIQEQEEKNVKLRESASRMREISVHVKATTREQSAGSHLITDAMEKITAMVHQIDQAVQEQQKSTSGVVASAMKIREVADQTQESMTQLDEVVNVLSEQIGILTEIISEFNISGTDNERSGG